MRKLLGYLYFNTETTEDLVNSFSCDIKNKSKKFVVTPNLDQMRLSYSNEAIRKRINSASYSTIDGKPILWIAKWLKQKDFKYKISGSDLSIDVLNMLNREKYSLFLFGGKPGVAEKAAKNITKKWPNIVVTGICCPDFGFEKNKTISQQYVDLINNSHPNVVFLCTSFPKSDEFFFNNIKNLTPALYFSVGATIDFLAGTIKRAPKWMSNIGLEWFYRLLKDFKRLYKRYFLDGLFLIKLYFMCHFGKEKLANIAKRDNENENSCD